MAPEGRFKNLYMTFSRIGSGIAQFFSGARGEAKKVSWPSQKQVLRHTIAVVALSLAVAIILGVFDYFFMSALNRFLL